jgi:hypothetical protein
VLGFHIKIFSLLGGASISHSVRNAAYKLQILMEKGLGSLNVVYRMILKKKKKKHEK